MPAEMPKLENRRASFRQEDDIVLRVRVLDQEAQQAIAADFDAFRLRYCMKSHVQNQISLRKPQLARIRRGKADVAEYLNSLEEQIIQLAERVDILSITNSDAPEHTCRATISTTGIRFETAVALATGQCIELGLLLSTVNTQIVTIGEVREVVDLSNGMFDTSVVFTEVHVEDIEVIASHLANLQRMELQARREGNGNSTGSDIS